MKQRTLRSAVLALHVALSSKTVDLMGWLSQQLLSGSISVDEAVRQLAAPDQASCPARRPPGPARRIRRGPRAECLVYLFLQRQIADGVTAGSTKG
jgi:hypothetical protein